MPEHLLDVSDVGAALEHQRRGRVPEHVARALLRHLALGDDLPHAVGERVAREGVGKSRDGLIDLA